MAGTSVRNVQKRKIVTPRGSPLHVPDGNAAAATPSSSSPRMKGHKRRPRRAVWIQPLINLGIFVVASWFGWKLVGAVRNLLQVGDSPVMTMPRQLMGGGESTPLTFEHLSTKAPICEAKSPDEIDFTLVTQLSQERLWMMRHHCERFPHAMSIAVYSNATLTETKGELEELGCDLNLVTVSVIDARRVGSPQNYPVNHLRNAAMAKVQTSHLIYVDVDFWLSENLYDILHAETIVDALSEDPKLGLVLPAFMLFRQCHEVVDCRNNNIPRMPTTRAELVQMMVGRRGHIFDPTNRGGHGSTLYKEWLRQDDATLMEIPCLKSHRYEPFVVIRWCRDLPPFPESFNGYGKNKLAWMMHVIRKGYTLSQVGGAFVVHYPHLESAARVKWNEAPKELQVPLKDKTIVVRRPKKSDGNLNLGSFKRGQVDAIFVSFRKWLEEEVPDVSRVEMCTDAQDDDAKLWIDKSEASEDQDQHDAEASAIMADARRIEEEAADVAGSDESESESDE